MILSHYVQKFNNPIVSKGAMNSFKDMFPLARMFLLAVMHTPSPHPRIKVFKLSILSKFWE